MSLIEVFPLRGYRDPLAEGALALARESGAPVERIEAAALYRVEGGLARPDLERLAAELLADPVTQGWRIDPSVEDGMVVDIWLKPQVTDAAAVSVERGARDLGLDVRARCGTRYRMFGRGLGAQEAKALAFKAFANPVVQDCEVHAG